MQLELLSKDFTNQMKEGKSRQSTYIFLKHKTLAHSKHSPVAAEVRGYSCRDQVGSLSPHIFSGLETLSASGFIRKGYVKWMVV